MAQTLLPHRQFEIAVAVLDEAMLKLKAEHIATSIRCSALSDVLYTEASAHLGHAAGRVALCKVLSYFDNETPASQRITGR